MRIVRPNNKVNKFFDEGEFNLEIDMGREWINGDNNFTVILYRVNKNTTSTTDIYNEVDVDSIEYLQPIELNVLPNLNSSQNKSYNQQNNTIRYKEDGDFSFIVYEKELSEKNAVISYGDFIGYDVDVNIRRYFEVIDDDILNFSNDKTILGYKRFYKEIRCKTVTSDVFNGI